MFGRGLKRPSLIGNDPPISSLLKAHSSTRNIVISVAAFALVIAVLSAIMTYYAYSEAYRYSQTAQIYVSSELPISPYTFRVGGSATLVELTLPNNLAPYIGKIFRIWSVSPQIHTLTIMGTGSTFDGSSTVATFGGAIGDGFVFEVVTSNLIVVISVNNVVFS